MSNVIARGTAEQVALVKQALTESTRLDLQSLLPADYYVEFHTPAQFLRAGYIIPGTGGSKPKTEANPKGGLPALGYVVGKNTLWINSDYAARRPARARHVIRHEVLHPIIASRTTPARKAAWLPLLRQNDGDPVPDWDEPYWNRPSEILADGLAAYVANRTSPFDGYGDIIDPAKALKILTAPDPAPPEPEPEPLPNPVPDPELLAAYARITELELALAVIADVATKAKQEEEVVP